jgi:hypothetical protein
MRARSLLLPFASILSFTAARPARADFVPDPKLAEPVAPPPTRPYWYGYQTLVVDGVSAAFLAGTTSSPLLGLVGYLGYVVGGPIVHGVHHRDGAVAVDLLLRLAAPFAGFVVGTDNVHCAPPGGSLEDTFCKLNGGVMGAEVTMIAVSLFDAMVLSWGSEPVPPEAARQTVAPTFALTSGGGVAGLGGSF